ELEAQRKRLGNRKRPIEFAIWDAEELSLVLKQQRDIVRDFFGPEWEARFFGDAPSTTSVEALLHQLVEQTAPRTQFVSNDWAPDALRPKLDQLRSRDPASYAQ